MSTLLRLATAGSVDDGKSTLVGRLLYDSKSVLADQMDAVRRVSEDKGLGHVDLALLTDGLRAEREQGITIDVAYRYFATPRRTFILADCPGHVQYTRNTVTGSSTADVLVLLVDVRKGVLEQTRRHLSVGRLLRVPHVILAVNKIDLIDYSADAYEAVAEQARALASGLGVDLHTIPVSALAGDNIVERSERTPWYAGPSLLELLETLSPEDVADADFRFPVQLTIRPQAAASGFEEYRGYAGRISSGRVAVGDEVVALPSGRRTRVVGIDLFGEELPDAVAPLSVTLRLADELDLARGEVLASGTPVEPTQDLDGTVAWLGMRPLRAGARVLLKHGTKTVQAMVRGVHGRLDLDTLTPVAAAALELNDIGRVELRLASPIAAEEYASSRTGGSFLLIDPQTGENLAAGMIRATNVDAFAAGDQLDWVI